MKPDYELCNDASVELQQVIDLWDHNMVSSADLDWVIRGTGIVILDKVVGEDKYLVSVSVMHGYTGEIVRLG